MPTRRAGLRSVSRGAAVYLHFRSPTASLCCFPDNRVAYSESGGLVNRNVDIPLVLSLVLRDDGIES